MVFLLSRVLTAIIGLPVVFFLIHTGNWPLQLAVFVCCVKGLDEIYKALSRKKLSIHVLGYLLSAAYLFILANFTFTKFIITSSIFIIALLIFLVFDHANINIMDCIITLFGFFYISFLLSFIVLVRKKVNGEFFTWLIFISAWGCDTCAYFSGKLLGRNKLVPDLSPKKTIEGAIGGTVGATLIALGYVFVYIYLFNGHVNINKNLCQDNISLIITCSALSFVGSIFAQLGDLSASAIKRYRNLKDYGNIFPGHGGFLDRFDSILFTAPVIYILLYFIS